MSEHRGIQSSFDSRRRGWRGSRDPLEITPMDIIAMVILMAILGLVLFGANS